jgi:murein DD-endopeptidase MepM/ murein hydrolase activator NlpD
VDGSRYSNDYGPRGSGFHYGIDMLAPTGTPIWAVKSGSVQYTLESAGGLVAYLSAVDGNVYYYAHMSEIIGDGDRGVGQGEPIGRVGQTGNATGPHLHFEIRLGGINGERTNPYPTLRILRAYELSTRPTAISHVWVYWSSPSSTGRMPVGGPPVSSARNSARISCAMSAGVEA